MAASAFLNVLEHVFPVLTSVSYGRRPFSMSRPCGRGSLRSLDLQSVWSASRALCACLLQGVSCGVCLRVGFLQGGGRGVVGEREGGLRFVV